MLHIFDMLINGIQLYNIYDANLDTLIAFRQTMLNLKQDLPS